MTEIWLVRHGETPWNAERRVQGWEDIDLNETGVEQARALGRHIKKLTQAGQRLDAVYTSDLKRAHATAQTVAREVGLPLNIHNGVRERHFGVLQGLVRDGLLTQQNQRRWASYRVAEDSPQSDGDSPQWTGDSPQNSPLLPGDSPRWPPELLSMVAPARSKKKLPAKQEGNF